VYPGRPGRREGWTDANAAVDFGSSGRSSDSLNGRQIRLAESPDTGAPHVKRGHQSTRLYDLQLLKGAGANCSSGAITIRMFWILPTVGVLVFAELPTIGWARAK
jgi:hypothetical protein